MSDPTTTTARSANRRTAAPESVGPIAIPVGGGLTVTVTAAADGEMPSVKAVKNCLERATRTARKAIAAGITDPAGFLALLAALAEAERLARAGADARDRVGRLLGGRRAEPPAGSPTGTVAPTDTVAPPPEERP